MAYNETVITAKNEEHFQALKSLLKTAFNEPLRTIDEWPDIYELEVAPLKRGQKRALSQLGYTLQDRTVYGSFSA